jgi:methylenetetrahydrofolate reductase (NADPH)
MTTASQTSQSRPPEALAWLLAGYSVEVTAHHAKALDVAAERLPPGAEVFIANLPNDEASALVETARRLHQAGLIPVPHVVARKLHSPRELDDLLARLAGEAGVDRVLALGGDRDQPIGTFDASRQLIQTGAFERHGIGKLAFACYPEGHPRIGRQQLEAALASKLAAAAEKGMETRLVGQFAFESEPILAFARRLRAMGISAHLRVGVAGPARRTALIKYALRCGVGASLRALTERGHLVSNLLGRETPEQLLTDIALSLEADPSLGIEGVHFFTFGAPSKSIEWAQDQLE